MASASGFDTAHQNLDILSGDSGTLENVQERFLVPYARGEVKVYTFQEAMGMKSTSFGGFNGKVWCSLLFHGACLLITKGCG